MNRSLFFLFLIPWLFNCQSKKEDKPIVYEAEVFDERVSLASLGFEKLSDYGFFEGTIKELKPGPNVFPYELNSPLFSDYAKKKRFIYLPEGSEVGYHETEVLDFPAGTVLIKNFYYTDDQLVDFGRIIETRLLIRKETDWVALPYIWNAEQTDAILEITGGRQEVLLTGKKPINYLVPNMAQCKGCHEREGKIEPIGPNARQLNKVISHGGWSYNQLQRLKQLGFLKNLPDENIPKLVSWEDEKSGSLDERSRAYLEINCAHCHRVEGPAKNSGLYLMASNTNEEAIGIMKAPVAAGKGSGNLKFDIVPGKPDESILIRRMNSSEAEVMMPELGRKLIHKEGVELIRNWIVGMASANGKTK